MRRTFDPAVPVDRFLKLQEPVETAVDRKAGKFPFDDPGEPDERADVVKTDRAERFVRPEDLKAFVFERFLLLRQILPKHRPRTP